MSRCFPFPPPGYEKKLTADDTEILKKEKRKEKKHKKDKKDREKREGKEKKEKDRSDGKHKEKKDKHRDKKKDKEKDREKERSKSSTSNEKRVDDQVEGYNGEKVHQKDEHSKEKSISAGDKKSSMQFQNGESNREQVYKKEESSREKSNSSDDKKASTQFWGQNGELPIRNRIKTEDAENSKFVRELDRRIRDEEKGTGSHQFLVESRKNGDSRVEIPQVDRKGIMGEFGFRGNAMAESKIEVAKPPVEKRVDNRLDEKEKRQGKEGDDKRGDKRKNKDRDKQKQAEKERKKEEKAKEKSEHKKAEREKDKHIKKNIPVAPLNNLSAHPPNSISQGVSGEANPKKRKEPETNGLSHGNEPANKMARPTSYILTENGRNHLLLRNQNSTLSNRQGAPPNNFKVDAKDQKINGIIASPPMSIPVKKPPTATANHIASKPVGAKSPFVNSNHMATQPIPISTTKPPPAVPNHVAAPNHITAPSLPIPSTKPPSPALPNHITAPSFSIPSTKPPSPAVPNHITAPSFPIPSTKPSSAIPNQTPVYSSSVSLTKPSPVAAAQPLPSSRKKPLLPTEPSIKPPHPDTKYLSQILTVPKLEQWSGFDDQEWLFGGRDDPPPEKKTRLEDSLQDNEELQVWSEARHIESVDVCALPYVIPY